MNPVDSHKIAFITPFSYDQMLFGLKKAFATFQRLMYLSAL